MFEITCFGSFGGQDGDEESPVRIRARIRKMERKQRHIREETVRVRE